MEILGACDGCDGCFMPNLKKCFPYLTDKSEGPVTPEDCVQVGGVVCSVSGECCVYKAYQIIKG